MLAARARRSDAEAVFLCGLIDTNVGEVLAALRRALPSVPVIGCDGLLPASLLFERAGPAARATYVSIEGLVNERAKVDIAAVYAAQAAELLLDAIARSNGTRASVSSELFETRVRDGLLGSFAIDVNGDPTATPITILRLEHGGGKRRRELRGGARGPRHHAPASTARTGRLIPSSFISAWPDFPEAISWRVSLRIHESADHGSLEALALAGMGMFRRQLRKEER